MIWKLPDAVIEHLIECNKRRVASGMLCEEVREIWNRELKESIKLHGIPAPFGEPEQR